MPVSVLGQEYQEYGVKVETIASNLTIPWDIDWASDGRIFFSERNGNLRVIEDGKLLPPILNLDVGNGEGGMLGVVLDPDFEKNHYIYIYYTYNEFLSTKNKLVRFVESDNSLTEDKILLEGIPGASYHDGGRIQFGPDGKLYVTTGDAGNPDSAQDLGSLSGKILRINSDGTIPNDNPFENSFVYSYGHRNPQGLDWDDSGRLYATEHGPSGFRGVAHDEVNLIKPGQNYGWPTLIGDESKQGMTNPVIHSGDDTWAPSGATFYHNKQIPDWDGKYFLAALRGEHLHVFNFDNDKVVSHEKLFLDEFGRLRDVVQGPDDALYVLTSNRDGRGNPASNDDRILRISALNDSKVTSFEECVNAGFPVMESYPRQCTTDLGKNFMEEIQRIPDWIRDVFEWYGDELVSEQELLNAIKFLIDQRIIIIN